jgi:para-nitrobenzyl esterase
MATPRPKAGGGAASFSAANVYWFHGSARPGLMRALSVLLFVTVAAVMPLTAAIKEAVRVEGGLLSGVPGSDPSVTVFRGIPFAAPPVGDLRWRAPQPPAPWQGVRKADQFSANCMQRMRDGLGPWTAEYQPHGPISEDCLYLNVWTAARSSDEKRPVLVYIHGGAFTDGSGNVPVYDGERPAKKGVVVVLINYRVGPLGFFTHPELTKESGHNSSGNYGLLDQVAALQWVNKNIAAFGGDPKRVTIGGQSAGAASVHYLTASPLAKGLFAGAIADSGANARMGPGRTLAQSEQNGARFAESRGARSLQELRALPADSLRSPLEGGFSFGPIIDGWFLPSSADEIFAKGEQSDVPTLTGWDYDEGSFNSGYGKTPAAEFEKLYPTSTQEQASDSQKAFAREQSMFSMYMWAVNRAKTSKTKVFTYLFAHPQPGATKDLYMTFHSSELPYVFDNLGKSDRPWTAEDRKIAALMSSYWVNFIKTGDPNGKGLPHWPAVNGESAMTMELGDRVGPRPIASQEKLDLFRQMFAAAR